MVSTKTCFKYWKCAKRRFKVFHILSKNSYEKAWLEIQNSLVPRLFTSLNKIYKYGNIHSKEALLSLYLTLSIKLHHYQQALVIIKDQSLRKYLTFTSQVLEKYIESKAAEGVVS